MGDKLEKEVFLIPYAHLDSQWRWEYPTTIEKYIANTMRENFELFSKFPGHRFSFTGAIRYGMMKEYFPEDFAKVKELVDGGRWSLAGTCLEETDVLVPSMESMIRNILYGSRWMKTEFRRSSTDYMIPDCFGFPANMPTVMAHCGISGFSTQKLTWNSAEGIPFELGVWKAPDGSETVSALNPGAYVSHLLLPVQFNHRRLERLRRLGRKNGLWKSFQYYGVGDIGGAPSKGSVRRALASIRLSRMKGATLSVRQGSPDEFFDALTGDEKQKMDRYEGDLLLIDHSAGTLTSAAIMKRWNRKNEQMAYAAEAAAVSAWIHTGATYPSDRIEAAWQRVIGSQMHDILPGTSTPTAYEFSHNDEVVALNLWSGILEDSARAMAAHVEGEGDVLLFNALTEERRNAVEIVFSGTSPGATAALETAGGRLLPAQKSRNAAGEDTLLFIPEMKNLSWTRLSVVEDTAAAGRAVSEILDPVRLTRDGGGHVLENAAYRIRVGASGSIESVYAKKPEEEILAKPPAYEFQFEKPGTFPAWNMIWKDRRKPPFHRIEGGAVEVREEGPLRCSLVITAEYGNSRFVREMSLTSGSDIVEFTERIEWRETGCSLKLAIDVPLEDPSATFNWESSRIQRPVNHSRCFEMPSRNWADLGGADWGVSILEDCKYGYDRPRENCLRMTLLYTPAIRRTDAFRDQMYHDWGEHTVRWALYAHEGDWKGTDRLAQAFNQPVHAFGIDGEAAGESTAGDPLFTLSGNQVGVSSIKKAEGGEGLVIRFYERHGSPAAVGVRFPVGLVSAMEINGLEEKVADLQFGTSVFTLEMGANALKSVLVKPRNAGIRRATGRLQAAALSLPLDSRLFSENGDASGGPLPRELAPAAIGYGPVEFRLQAGSGNDSLFCDGQELSLPAGTDRLFLLAASDSDEPIDVRFIWLDSESGVISETGRSIGPVRGWLGQWDRRLWKKTPRHLEQQRRDYVWMNRCTGVEPGYIRRNRLAWFATHTHDGGKDCTYRFGYLYAVEMKVPAGAVNLRLPPGKQVRLAAATVAEGVTPIRSVRSLRDKYDY